MFLYQRGLGQGNSPPGGKRRSLKPAFQGKARFSSGFSVACLRAAAWIPTLCGKRGVVMENWRRCCVGKSGQQTSRGEIQCLGNTAGHKSQMRIGSAVLYTCDYDVFWKPSVPAGVQVTFSGTAVLGKTVSLRLELKLYPQSCNSKKQCVSVAGSALGIQNWIVKDLVVTAPQIVAFQFFILTGECLS